MTIAFAESASGNSTSGTSIQTACVVQGGSDMAYIAILATRNVAASSMAGGGLTWTKRVDQRAARATTWSTLWTAYGSPGATFTPCAVINSAATATLIVSRYTGVDNSNPYSGCAGWNTCGINGPSAGGTDSTTACMTLTSTSSNSVNVFTCAPRSNTITTTASGYTQQASATAGGGASQMNVYFHDKPIPTALTDIQNHVINAANDWVDTGIVLQPAGAGAGAAVVRSSYMRPTGITY